MITLLDINHHRSQTVQLLQKFQKARLIVDVRGPKHEKADFIDNGRLYRSVKYHYVIHCLRSFLKFMNNACVYCSQMNDDLYFLHLLFGPINNISKCVSEVYNIIFLSRPGGFARLGDYSFHVCVCVCDVQKMLKFLN